MKDDRGLALLATGSVILAFLAFVISTAFTEPMKMAAYRTKDEIRVICYLPDQVNRKLQAHASLEGISKQELTSRILTEWVDATDVKLPKKKTAPKPAPEPTE